MPFLLDTNVVSELRKGERSDAGVKRWQEAVGLDECYLSVISLLEIRTGIRRVCGRDPGFGAELERWYRERVGPAFDGRIIPVTTAVAEAAAEWADRQSLADGLIAASAKVHGLTVATRNTAHFEAMKVPVVNPWSARAQGGA